MKQQITDMQQKLNTNEYQAISTPTMANERSNSGERSTKI
jgi:hypothetical protein